MATFAERLKNLRVSRKIMQKDIVSATGVSLRAYQYYENGTREPTLSTLIALADFFHVTLDYLAGRDDG